MQHSALALLIVLDAVGVSTLNYLLDHRAGRSIHLPNLALLGLGQLLEPRHHYWVRPQSRGNLAMAREQQSVTADSTTGHREMMGVVDYRSFELFPHGFPLDFIAELERRIGGAVLFNQMCGGDEAIRCNLGEHTRTRRPIVYASKCDPLIQIAADEAIIPVADLHSITEAAFQLAGEMGIRLTRSIARPFVMIGDDKHKRTGNRHDYVLPLPGNTLIDVLRQQGVTVCSVGKPADLVTTSYDHKIALKEWDQLSFGLRQRFVHNGQTSPEQNPYTAQGIHQVLHQSQREEPARGTFVFANFVDMDSVFGHTQDVMGGLHCLHQLDAMLEIVMSSLRVGDLLVITADHGMEHRGDYGYHSREPVPLLVWQKGVQQPKVTLGTSPGLTDVGAVIAQYFNCTDDFKGCITEVLATQ